MSALKQWFDQLEKREQWIVLIGSVVLLAYLLYVLGYRQLADKRDYYQQQNANASQTLQWMKQTVKKIDDLRGSGRTSAQGLNQSMAQLAEKAASRAAIRISRFAPDDENHGQIWFERIEFDQLLLCLSALELDYAIAVDSIDINAVSAPGLVNARLKVSR